jgi:quinol monooxygenase YgiN
MTSMPNPASVKVALVVRLVARPGEEEALAAFLTAAGPLAEAERFTPVWFALRTAPAVFYIVDAFASDTERQQHITGDIAAALRAKAGALLAEPPSIEPADVLVAKY